MKGLVKLLKSGLIKSLPSIIRQVSQRVPTRLISREILGQTGIEKVPYMFRHYLQKDRDEIGWFLHKFVSSDEERKLHSHPWEWSFSIILEGGYVEYRAKKSYQTERCECGHLEQHHREVDGCVVHFRLSVPHCNCKKYVAAKTGAKVEMVGPQQTRVFRPLNVNVILHDDFHRVEILSKEVWTLFCHGPRRCDWGFIPEQYETKLPPIEWINGKTFDNNLEVNPALTKAIKFFDTIQASEFFVPNVR